MADQPHPAAARLSRVLALFGMIPGVGPAEDQGAADATTSPIKHLVVIFQA